MKNKPNIQYLLFNNYKVQFQTIENNKSYVLIRELLYAFEVTKDFNEYRKDETFKSSINSTRGIQTTQLKFYAEDNKLREQLSILADDIPMFLTNLNARSKLKPYCMGR